MLFCSGGGDRPALNAAMSGHWAKAGKGVRPKEINTHLSYLLLRILAHNAYKSHNSISVFVA